MSLKLFNKSKIKKILLISLTNIGDVILTFPVLDILKRDFPSATLSVVIGPKAKSLFNENPHLDKVHVFDKHQSSLKSFLWVCELRKEHFDLVVDLRNTAIPFMTAPRYRTSYRVKKDVDLHMKEKHIDRLKSVYDVKPKTIESRALCVSTIEEEYVNQLIEKEIGREHKYVIIAPGAADESKRWPQEQFALVCDRLIKEHALTIVFVGDTDDRKVAQHIDKSMEASAVNLCGRTNLIQLAQLFKHCYFTIVNDSAPMHLASYLNVPVLALFGPTDPSKYGPWSLRSRFLRKNESCRACAHPHTPLKHECMKAITDKDVFNILEFDRTNDCVGFRR